MALAIGNAISRFFQRIQAGVSAVIFWNTNAQNWENEEDNWEDH